MSASGSHDAPLRPCFRFGTSSWSEESWVGSFYPPGMKPADFLTHYATQFDTVELDASYYRLPSRAMVSGWERKTPPGFTLCAKSPRSIVHGGESELPNSERLLVRDVVQGDVDEFLGAMSLLGQKCGPLVLQFPYFNRQAFAGSGPFLERLDGFLAALPKEFRYGVEVRNRAWIAPELLDLLRSHRVALVWVDIAYMPHPADLAREFDIVTTDFVYARLIGNRKKIDALTDRFDRIVLDQSPRIERWAELLQRIGGSVKEIFAFANNHYAGHGPATIRQLAAYIRGEGRAEEMPPKLGGVPF